MNLWLKFLNKKMLKHDQCEEVLQHILTSTKSNSEKRKMYDAIAEELSNDQIDELYNKIKNKV